MLYVAQVCAGDPNDRCGGLDRLAVYEMYPRPCKMDPVSFRSNICSVPSLKYIDMTDVLILFLLPIAREGNVFTGICLSTIGLMDTGSLLGLVKARSVRILLECFLV